MPLLRLTCAGVSSACSQSQFVVSHCLIAHKYRSESLYVLLLRLIGLLFIKILYFGLVDSRNPYAPHLCPNLNLNSNPDPKANHNDTPLGAALTLWLHSRDGACVDSGTGDWSVTAGDLTLTLIRRASLLMALSLALLPPLARTLATAGSP